VLQLQHVQQLSGSELYDPATLMKVELQIQEVADEQDRNHLLYALAERLISEWILDDAERVARLIIEWPYEVTWLFEKLAECWSKLGRKEYALRLIDEAIDILGSTGVTWQRAEALTKLARRWMFLGNETGALDLWKEAISIARLVEESSDAQDAIDASSVLWEISEDLVVIAEWGLAQEVAATIRSPSRRARAVTRIEKMRRLAHISY
jgi:tetratricopeptide (TPR) repeat protein